MGAKAPNLNVYGSDITIADKETQTSATNIISMSNEQTSNPKSAEKEGASCNDDNIKVFEFCELVRDPQDDTVSIIKETFTEEVISDDENSAFGKPSHNRYKYCREVVQPYCKTYTSACPKYMPTHREIPFKKSLSNTSKGSISSNLQVNSSGNIMMKPDENKTTFENPSNIKQGQKRGKECNPTLPRKDSRQCQKEATNCEPYSKCPQYKDETKLKGYLSSCLSTTVTIAKKASAACLEKCEKTIGILPPKCGQDNPTYYVLKKPKSKESVIDKSSYDSIVDSEIVQSLKSGVKGVVDTVINTTKDTVKMFTNSGCKEQERNRKTRDCENKSVTNVVSVLPNELKNEESKEGILQKPDLNKIKTILTNTFNRQDNDNSNETLDKRQENTDSNEKPLGLTEKISTILAYPFKSKDNTNKFETSSSTNVTNIFQSLKSKESEDSSSSSLTKITNLLPNPFKSKNEEANKSSFSKITSLFKTKEDPDSEMKKSLTRIKSIISGTFKRDDRSDTASVKDNVSLSKMVEPAVAAIERISSVISSTASSTLSSVKDIKDSTVSSVKGVSMTDILNSRFDRSSPEDDPNKIRVGLPKKVSHDHKTPHTPPTNVSNEYELKNNINHHHETPANVSLERKQEPQDNSSMFTMLKSKLLSMFADSTEDDDTESEEGEEDAEKTYNKFSDF